MAEADPVDLISVGIGIGANLVTELVSRSEYDVLDRMATDVDFADGAFDLAARHAFDGARSEAEPTEADFDQLVDAVIALAREAN